MQHTSGCRLATVLTERQSQDRILVFHRAAYQSLFTQLTGEQRTTCRDILKCCNYKEPKSPRSEDEIKSILNEHEIKQFQDYQRAGGSTSAMPNDNDGPCTEPLGTLEVLM
ncbi:hypothetical protein ElyMa_006046200 [Elysia marginata]|uniref:Uncharacterized protein n=1 Tax=Elysia marginata TaxID=1093978 RepID=A0AAV4GL52_9GAST|nr:hypothetical protein ElyMa_006046200 [Elysia marginata]